MNTNDLKKHYYDQFIETLARYTESDPKCAMAAGMLVILSALKAKDGPNLAFHISVMHAALRDVGTDMGWGVEANK